MAIETKQEYLERVLAMEKPKCPHCGETMNLWEVPPINFSDGLGWGSPYLYLCFNDQCPLYVQGWQNLEDNYAQKASMRCLNYPGTEQFDCMPVFSPFGGQGQILDDQVLAEEQVLKENTKKGFSILATCYVEKDGVTVLRLLTDACEPMRVRVKAAQMIGDIGEVEAVEPLRYLKVGNEILQNTIDSAIARIHERHFTRECPFCAEIIKKRASICKHCNRDVAGQ
jgi:ribosomal protein L37AE/L43A